MNEYNKSTFSKKLVEFRKKRGLTQYTLAEALGFSRGLISNYEQGRREPDYNTLKVFADFFDVSTDELLGRQLSTQIRKISGTVKDDSEKLKSIKKLLERESIQSLLDYLEDKDEYYIKLVLDIAIRIEQREKSKDFEE